MAVAFNVVGNMPTKSACRQFTRAPIAQHVPDIESLNILLGGILSENRETITYFGQLSKLRPITLCFKKDDRRALSEFTVPAIRTMGAANNSLKYLHLYNATFDLIDE